MPLVDLPPCDQGSPGPLASPYQSTQALSIRGREGRNQAHPARKWEFSSLARIVKGAHLVLHAAHHRVDVAMAPAAQACSVGLRSYARRMQTSTASLHASHV